MKMADSLSCSSCRLTFADVEQLVEHSSRPCTASDADDVGVEPPDGDVGSKTGSNVDDGELEPEMDADDFVQPQLRNMRQSPDFDADDNIDDERIDQHDECTPKNIPSRQMDKVFEPGIDNEHPGSDAFPAMESELLDDEKPPTAKAGSSLASAANVSQLIDNNVSPASKIAMLESVVYALHQQQMFQLELIEALRRQLAAALASSSSSSTSTSTRAADESTLDLTVPRSAADAHGSSLSSLMRLSAGVDARRAQIPGFSSLSTSPATLPGSTSEGQNASSWPEEPSSLSTSRFPSAPLPSSMLSTPKHAPALSELSLFKKSKPPNVTVMRPTDSIAAETAGDESSTIFKHRCRLCLKVLGSDSALQIHMRSHTGERPYKCNICGNRFTTKGNLKVHFQRHLEQYPNARMNPDPVPEYLDHQDAGHGHDRHMAPPAHAVSASGFSNMQSARHSSTPSNKSAGEQPGWSTTSVSDGLGQAKDVAVGGGLMNAGANMPVKLESSIGHEQRRLPESSHGLTLTSSLSTADSHTQFQSPLSALSSMSSALSAFAPQLRMTFPPPPPPPMSSAPPAAAVFSPFSMDSTPPLPPPPAPPSKELDDEDLEQYMEIQQTDTARIEELVREATVGVPGSGRVGDGSAPTDPNECVICHRVLSCRSALLMHYRTHTGERPYRCRLCGRTFTTKGNLKTHMAVHRGRISGLSAAAGQHRCRICRRDFPNSVALQQHLRTAHAPEMTATSNGPFPFPATAPGGNAAAAAMMMMPAVNPLLPFFNFSSFYHAPRNLFAPAAGVPGAEPMQPATAGHKDEGGIELDLRKPSNVDENYEDSRPRKRVKGEDRGSSSASDPDGCWQDDVEMIANVNGYCDSLSKSSLREFGRFSPVTNDDDDSNGNELRSNEPETEAVDNEKSLSVVKSELISADRRDEFTTTDGGQPFPTERDGETCTTTAAASGDNSSDLSDRIAAKFASPLLALEERVNSLNYSTNMFSRFSVAAASVAHRDEQEFGPATISSLPDDDCDMESDATDQERSSAIQDLRTRDYGLSNDEGDELYSREGRRLTALSPSSAQKLMMSSQSDIDGRSDDSGSSRRSASPNAVARPESSGSGASSSHSNSAVPSLHVDRSDLGPGSVQSPPKVAPSTPTRFSCQVCAKPFASASALEIHSRTHSGDRPFVCHVCSKAFTTKGNLKVHMSTHAWNKCPSRRGRRMTVVDPAAAAAVAAASATFPVSIPAPKDAAATAAAAAFLSNTFGAGVRFDGTLPPPPPMFGGYVPPPAAVAGNGVFFSDKTLLNYCMQAAAAASHNGARDGSAADILRQSPFVCGGGDWKGATTPWIVGAGSVKDERNNNNGGRANDGVSLNQRGGGGGVGGGEGELDLSARSIGASAGNVASSFGDRQSSPGMRSWTSDRGSALPLISNCT